MKVGILAAGYGTRLYPLTIHTPKALLSIKNKPIINYLMDKIENLKKYTLIEEIKLISNNRFCQQFTDWREKYGFKVEIINDGSNSPSERKGAIKAIQLAVGKDLDNWLILGSDNIFEDSLVDFIEFSFKNTPYPTVAIYDIKEKEQAKRFGVIRIDSDMRLIELKEKPQFPESTLIATCIYFFPKESLSFLNSYLVSEKVHTDASGKYIEWLIKQTKVYGKLLKGKWLDIGNKDELMKAEEYELNNL